MKHQPITAQHIHARYCDCWACNPHRVIDARRVLMVWSVIFLPVLGLGWALWTILPR